MNGREEDVKCLATPLFVHQSKADLYEGARNGNVGTSDSKEGTNGYKRKVIDSIVTAIPYSHTRVNNEEEKDEQNSGEVQVCIEEYSNPRDNTNVAPLLRRVAVRTYGDIENNGSGGLLQASFSLPIAPLPHEEKILPNQEKNWLCWTTFASSNKPYLCALVGPNTLRIFDVYPNPKSDSESIVGVGEGHTVSLPFEASSIFALPPPYGGLIIQRSVDATVSDDNTNLTQQEQSGNEHIYCPHDSKAHQTKDASFANSSQQDFDFIVEGPPSTLRLGSLVNTNMKIKPPSSSYTPTNLRPRLPLDDDVSPTSSCTDDSVINRMIGSTSPHGNSSTPSVYSLHHPLDEVRPCVILCSETVQSERDKNNSRVNQSKVWRKRTPILSKAMKVKNPVYVYRNSFERIVHVQKPRSFLDIRSSENGTIDDDIIIVTYNIEKRCHGVWILNEAPPPPPTVPLWKITSLNTSNVGDRISASNPGKHNGKSMDVDGSNEPQVEDDHEVRERKNFFQQKDTSPFSDLHAHVSMTCIHSTSWKDDPKVSPLDTEECQQFPATLVFLATTAEGRGDFVLCLLVHDETSDKSKTSVLRCLEFDPYSEPCSGEKRCWKVIKKYNIPCVAAQPIHSTTITPEHFPLKWQPNCLKSRKKSFNIHGYDTPRATDILVCSTGEKSSSTLCLFRGNLHISNFDIPAPDPNSADEIHLKLLYGLENPVDNRVDVLFKGLKSNICRAVRASFSLECTNSLISDLAISAIGSAFEMEAESLNRDSLLRLAFAIRTDCIQLSQYRSSISTAYDVVDIEWDSFCKIISSFLSIALGKGPCLKPDDQRGNEVENECNGDAAWNLLMESNFHSDYVQNNGNRLLLLSNPHGNGRVPRLAESKIHDFVARSESIKWISSCQNEDILVLASTKIFDALHIVYEDLKVKRAANTTLYTTVLGTYLHDICKNCVSDNGDQVMADFVTHYERDLTVALTNKKAVDFEVNRRISSDAMPICAFTWIESIIKGQNICEDYIMNGVCSCFGALLRFYIALFDGSISQLERDRRLVLVMVEEGIIEPSYISDSMSPSLALPLFDALHRCRSNPPALTGNWTPSAFNLIGRNDLAKIKMKAKPIKAVDSLDITGAFQDDDPENDGLVSIEKYAAMQFPNDSRVRDAARLLRSSRPVFLRVQRAVEVSDHEYERMKQQKLALLCRRVLPLPVGRGMMTLGTMDNKSFPIEPLIIPKICLSGRIPPQNTLLALDENRCTSKHKMWPDFHNGVAAGLQLPPATEEAKRKMSRTWIVCNKPNIQRNTASQPNQPNVTQEPDHMYGGFLLALGLRGHLSSLSNTDICDFINEGPFTTAVGVMLGLAANKRGTCDVTVSKTLCVHIPSLLPTSFRSIDLASPVQAAAVAGVGLLYQGSAHRLLTEFLLNEMGKRPTVDQNTDDREGYNLCCGLSLGMVNLCLRDGSNKFVNDGLSDLDIEERLHRYIVGGVDQSSAKQRNRGADRAFGGVNGDSEKSSRIYEGNMINVDVTAPGATMALGMIYHRSGSKSVASLLSLPDTSFALDTVRPDFLFSRVVSKALVLWDDIEATEKWIKSQIPIFIRSSYANFRRKAERNSGMDGLATFAAMSMEGKRDSHQNVFDNTDDNGVASNVKEDRAFSPHEDTSLDVNYNSIRQAHAYITAGACFSIGLRYAGTGNAVAFHSITTQISELQKLRDDSDTISAALKPDMPTIELCLGAAALSLGMVMAGTGDIKSFKLLRTLRWKCEMDVKYGNHMAYASAIGLLFLGGGTCTLGNDPADIAALLISFFPRYPIFTHDNRYHLQALRHLYALAVRKRKIEAIDVDSNEKVLVPMEFDFGDKMCHKAMTPSILLNRGKTCKIRVTCDRYYPVEVVLDNVPAFNSTLSIFVKKKSGRLSYIQDPHGMRSLFTQVGRDRVAAREFIKSFVEDHRMVMYANHICDSNEGEASKNLSLSSIHMGDFCVDIVQECLRDEKTDAINIHLALYNDVNCIEKVACPSTKIQEFRLLKTLYRNSDCFELVSPHFVSLLCESIDRFFSALRNEDPLGKNKKENYGRWEGPISLWGQRIGFQQS
uniref:Anaphase-promoting complex subunit 1 n=1 Tax=Chaetoceros debilis TaxID=122233 RepID=A0A7S3QC95_9STRA